MLLIVLTFSVKKGCIVFQNCLLSVRSFKLRLLKYFSLFKVCTEVTLAFVSTQFFWASVLAVFVFQFGSYI